MVAFYVFGLVYLRRWLFEQQIELVLTRLQLQNKIVCPIYLLTGYPVRTEKYQAKKSHSTDRTEMRSLRRDWGLSIFQYGPGNQLINSLLTGYKILVSCDKISMSRDKKGQLT